MSDAFHCRLLCTLISINLVFASSISSFGVRWVRVLAIAHGAYKPKPGELKIWFTSMKSLAEVLSDDNRALLQAIRDRNPESISALAEATGRKVCNLSPTLKTMSRYGIVEMRREENHVRPIVKGGVSGSLPRDQEPQGGGSHEVFAGG